MFMRENRRKNGAEQPETVAKRDSSAQRSGRKLAPNPPVDNSPDDLRFTPNMGTCAQINENHYQAGVSGAGPYGTSYEQHIPYVGEKPVHEEGGRGLKSR